MFKKRRHAISRYRIIFTSFPRLSFPPFPLVRTNETHFHRRSIPRSFAFISTRSPPRSSPIYSTSNKVFYDRPVGEQVLVTICRTRRPLDVRLHPSTTLSLSLFLGVSLHPGRGRTIKFVCPLKHNACCVRSSARPKKNSIYRTVAYRWFLVPRLKHCSHNGSSI